MSVLPLWGFFISYLAKWQRFSPFQEANLYREEMFSEGEQEHALEESTNTNSLL